MILDTLNNWNRYAWNCDAFEKAFRFLDALDPTVADGRYDIDGDKVYCMLQSYETRPREGHQYEAHRTYADIQYMVEGCESILWAPTEGLSVVKPYVPDIEFYALTPNPTDVILAKGRFCVLFPQDAHAPCTMLEAPATARKAVIKVRIAG